MKKSTNSAKSNSSFDETVMKRWIEEGLNPKKKPGPTENKANKVKKENK